MPAEILIMCARCGRPQRAGDTCIGCGFPLPPPLGSNETIGRDKLLEAYQPFLEADLGLNRRLVLSSRRLEWHPQSGEPVIAEVTQLERVSLVQRPVWESLLIGAFACLGAVFASPWAIRALLGGIALLAVAACFLQKRYALVLKLKDGRARNLELGIGTRRAPVVERIQSVWSSLRPALEELGIRT